MRSDPRSAHTVSTLRPYVTLRTSEGTRFELVHGDLIGRLASAAMPLNDGRVSEAHAMISLREQELRLIALRGAFALEGKPLSEAALRPGQEIMLAQGLVIEVEAVHLPEWVLGLEASRLPRQVLPSVCSILASPELRLVSGYAERAAARIWSTGDGWSLSLPGTPTQALEPGHQFQVDTQMLHAVAIPLAAAGQAPTLPQTSVVAPLQLVAQFETVHIFRSGAEAAVFGGIPARILSELVALGGPAHWTVLTGLLWPREDDADAARSRLDVSLSRLRRKLKELRIRTDLVHTNGAGQIELLLYPGDTVEDRT